jgi:hypothetical protein
VFTDSAHLTPLYEPYGIIAIAVALSSLKKQAIALEKGQSGSNAAFDEVSSPLNTARVSLEYDHVLAGL